jgi:hypothetical protein
VSMSRSMLTALLVLVCLAISGLVAFSDFNSNAYRRTQKSANADWFMPAEADGIVNDLSNIVSHIRRHTLTPAVSECWQELKRKTFYSKEDSRIYKLHGVFRI